MIQRTREKMGVDGRVAARLQADSSPARGSRPATAPTALEKTGNNLSSKDKQELELQQQETQLLARKTHSRKPSASTPIATNEIPKSLRLKNASQTIKDEVIAMQQERQKLVSQQVGRLTADSDLLRHLVAVDQTSKEVAIGGQAPNLAVALDTPQVVDQVLPPSAPQTPSRNRSKNRSRSRGRGKNLSPVPNHDMLPILS